MSHNSNFDDSKMRCPIKEMKKDNSSNTCSQDISIDDNILLFILYV